MWGKMKPFACAVLAVGLCGVSGAGEPSLLPPGKAFEPGRYIVHAFHYNGYGPERRRFNAQRAPYTPAAVKAWQAGDEFVVDYVRVYDIVDRNE